MNRLERSIDTIGNSNNIEPTDYSEVLAGIQEDPAGYARAVKAFNDREPGAVHRFGLRKIIRDFTATDTSNENATMTRSLGKVALPDEVRGMMMQAIHSDDKISGRYPDDSVLMGELPINASGSSLAERTKEFMTRNELGSLQRLSGVFDLEVEAVIKRYQKGELRDVGKKGPTGEERKFTEGNEDSSRKFVEDLRRIYLKIDAELAGLGVEL